MIDWESNETHYFGNEALPTLAGHIWVGTSGTVQKKWVALSKRAFLVSATAVNSYLQASKEDIWLQPLPNHHVGGLSIWARAFLSGSKVVDYPDVTRKKWDVSHYYQTLLDSKATLTSLVPTQLYDLVNHGYAAPAHVRGVFIGGGYLSESLAYKARSLDWPLIPTYGCTECCSQIATGSPLKVLPHVEVRMEETLWIKSESLLTGFFTDVFHDPKIDGWYDTGDIVQLDGNLLKPIGRRDEQYKIRGEKVLLTPLKQLLEEIAGNQYMTLTVEVDERIGHKLILLVEDGHDASHVYQAFNSRVPSYSRIEAVRFVNTLNRNALGKIQAHH